MNNNRNSSEILIYESEDSKTRIDVRLENETLWLTQIQMAELFHTNNIFNEGELVRDSVVKESFTTAAVMAYIGLRLFTLPNVEQN